MDEHCGERARQSDPERDRQTSDLIFHGHSSQKEAIECRGATQTPPEDVHCDLCCCRISLRSSNSVKRSPLHRSGGDQSYEHQLQHRLLADAVGEDFSSADAPRRTMNFFVPAKRCRRAELGRYLLKNCNDRIWLRLARLAEAAPTAAGAPLERRASPGQAVLHGPGIASTRRLGCRR
jgi:hypothetical protein